MTERPILFSAPMVRAILAGRKTQTRRIVRGVDECPHGYDGVVTHAVPKEAHLRGRHCFNLASGESAYIRCPYGARGDVLWVRETHRANPPGARVKFRYRADTSDGRHPLGEKWTPAIHMPRAACRIRLVVTKVGVERLYAISEKDARAEGMVHQKWSTFAGYGWTSDPGQPTSESARRAYEDLWFSINGSWTDCWVWVVSFMREA